MRSYLLVPDLISRGKWIDGEYGASHYLNKVRIRISMESGAEVGKETLI